MGSVGFLYIVALPAELVLLWLAFGAWPPLGARVASSSFVLVVAATTMLLIDPWEMGLALSALPGLVAAYALPFHVKDLLGQRHGSGLHASSR